MNGISKLLLGIHCHQPVDNFSSVVDMAIVRSYKPFFETVAKYPTFRFSVHFSGWLFDYIRVHDEELFALIKKCHSNGQIEFFTGGFYEPILASIPSRDRIGQITMLNDFLFKHFGAKPKGLWLTERVWDASVIDDIVKCGVEYVTVDDYHFISAGFDKQNLNGYFLSKNGGNVIKIFPINKELRYVMPFKKPSVVIEHIKNTKGAGVLFDDGEKFGLWPKTYEWVYENGWLDEFLSSFTADKGLMTQTYSDFVAQNKPLGMAYLPNVSYYEMGEWSLKARDTVRLEHLKHDVSARYGDESADKFVKGGIWKNFLVKYSESNRIHKRALQLAALADSINDERYTDALYKAQTNDALWHGVFGGLYLGCLRDNAYKFIIECENIYKEANPTRTLVVSDINLDGYDEVQFLTAPYTICFDSKNGGQLCEFALRDKLYNIQNGLTRRYEAYHEKIFNPPPVVPVSADEIETIHNLDLSSFAYLKDEIAYDWYDKNSFIDHIVDDSFCLANFKKCTFKEYGDFANQPTEILLANEQNVTFERRGGIYTDEKTPLTLQKSFAICGSGFRFEMSLASEDSSCAGYSFMCEVNLHLPDIEQITVNSESVGRGLELGMVSAISVRDRVLGKVFAFKFDDSVEAFVYPVDTVSQNEAGFELSNQAVCFGFKVPMSRHTKFAGRFDVSL